MVVSKCPNISHSEVTYIALHARIVHNLVDLVGGDSRLCGTRRDIEHFASQPTHFSHAFLFLLGENLDLVATDEYLARSDRLSPHTLRQAYLLALRNAIVCVVRMPYPVRHSTTW